ncbi:hypothetical protein N9993_00815 [bacterium]|jgi:hypothetical protein|nr:hypothetical protein [bacterium]
MPLENTLNNFATYNYNWVFGVLSPRQVPYPESYENGPAVPIIKSGGFPDKAVTTLIEDATKTNVEFFIDNVITEYLVAPNPGTSFSNAIQIEFTVTEPQSVGLFFQSLSIAAEQALGTGVSYLGAPFLLQGTFKGFDDNNNPQVLPSTNLVLKLVNVTFEVTAAGSTYHVTAIPWNHQAFFDQVEKIPTETKLQGASVSEVLSWGENSLEAYLNKIQTDMAAADSNYVPHQYEINFPKDISIRNQPRGSAANSNLSSNAEIAEFNRSIGGGGIWDGSQTNLFEQSLRDKVNSIEDNIASDINLINQTYQNRISALESTLGLDTALEDVAINNQINSVINKQSSTITNLTSSPANTVINTNDNEMGQSLITSSAFDYGTIPFKAFNNTTVIVKDDGTRIVTRAGMTYDQDQREFQFGTGQKIEKIIESVLLGSEWGKSKAEFLQRARGNTVTWFKIHSKTTIIDTGMIAKTGMPATRFEYIVTPYEIHISRLSNQSSSQSYSPQIKDAVKHYNYTYTGLNTDIIDFNFNINNAFYKEMSRIGSQGGQDTQHNSGNPVVTEEVAQRTPSVGAGPNPQGTGAIASANVALGSGTTAPEGGSSNDSAKIRIANHFNKMVLNSDTDNVTLDLRIWGDPFYFTEVDIGNNHPNLSATGYTSKGQLDFTRGEIYVLISFKTAVDFFGNLTALDPASAFSGLYKVTTFKNEFSNGMFTQQLNLLRMPNQSLDDVNAATSVVQATKLGNPNLVIQKLNNQISAASNQTQDMLQQAQQQLKTGFTNNKINDFENILSGTEVANLAENIFSAFSQVNAITANLNTTIGAITSQVPGIFQNLSANPATNQLLGSLSGLSGGALQQAQQQLSQGLNTSLASAQQQLLGSVSAGKIPGYINRASNTAANQFSTEVSRITKNLGF